MKRMPRTDEESIGKSNQGGFISTSGNVLNRANGDWISIGHRQAIFEEGTSKRRIFFDVEGIPLLNDVKGNGKTFSSCISGPLEAIWNDELPLTVQEQKNIKLRLTETSHLCDDQTWTKEL